jgi:hypothetical protein
MQTSQFETIKVGMKQDNSGYILTLRIHPDEAPEELLRDFVGARYMAVLVRVNEDERPMNREEELGKDMVRTSGMLCRDPDFWEFLIDAGEIFDKSEKEATEWMHAHLKVKSRSEIVKSQTAIQKLLGVKQEFKGWKESKD